MDNTRKGYLDIAKAIGIIIVLINHIGLNLGSFNGYLGAFYVSEFFFLAGMTFHVKEEKASDFVKRKAKRLLLPYCGYSVFYLLWYVLRTGMAGALTLQDFMRKLSGCVYARNYLFVHREEKLYLMEIMNAPMWFLPALFVSLCIYYGFSRYLGEKRGYGVVASLVTGILLHYLCPVLLPWSIDTALIMQPLLWAGERLAKIDYITVTREKLWILPVVLSGFYVIVSFNGAGNSSVGEYGVSVLLFLAASCLGTFLCIMVSYYLERYLHFLGKAFMIVGGHTLDILCFHLFVFALAQTGCTVLGLNTENPLIQAGIIVVGIVIPVLLGWVIQKFRLQILEKKK